jgi:hypothetical protein
VRAGKETADLSTPLRFGRDDNSVRDRIQLSRRDAMTSCN